jgi:hypothetical protein
MTDMGRKREPRQHWQRACQLILAHADVFAVSRALELATSPYSGGSPILLSSLMSHNHAIWICALPGCMRCKAWLTGVFNSIHMNKANKAQIAKDCGGKLRSQKIAGVSNFIQTRFGPRS